MHAEPAPASPIVNVNLHNMPGATVELTRHQGGLDVTIRQAEDVDLAALCPAESRFT